MEIKKSSGADLEQNRLQAFLLGVVVVLACLFVALEYSWDEEDFDEADLEAMEAMLDQVELASLQMPEDMVPLVQPQQPPAPTKLNIVDDAQAPDSEEHDEETAATLDEQTEADADHADAEEMPANDDTPIHFSQVENLPEFPGGAAELVRWLTRNLSYPQVAQRQKIQGKVLAQFIINRDGSVQDIQIVQSLSPHCDYEAMRVLRMMPKWKAGKQNDKPCRTMVCIPIVFKL